MRSVIIAATLLAFSGAAFAGDCKEGEVLDAETGKCSVVMTDEKPAEEKK